jgi:hypothetical protein
MAGCGGYRPENAAVMIATKLTRAVLAPLSRSATRALC